MRIVFDTNIIISAAISKGNPHDLLIRAIAGEFVLLVSKELLNELEEVLSRPKLKFTNDEARHFIDTVKRTVKILKLKSNFKVVKEDPDDDLVLNTAYDAKADFIVSGDRHLLRLKEFRGIKIIGPSKMLEILKRK